MHSFHKKAILAVGTSVSSSCHCENVAIVERYQRLKLE